MSSRKPLVLGDGATLQQLQSPDDLDIPLDSRVAILEERLQMLIEMLALNGIELSEELL